MQPAFIDEIVSDGAVGDDDPIIAPLLREQLEPMLGGKRDNGVGGPERALMRALLQDAVLCLIGEAAPAKERPKLAEEARYWVASRSRGWVFSFERVCESLDIEPEYARKHLLAMAERHGVVGDAAEENTEAPPRERCQLRSMRGLRHGGDRPRRAIHFMVERRRRKRAAAEA